MLILVLILAVGYALYITLAFLCVKLIHCLYLQSELAKRRRGDQHLCIDAGLTY